MIAASPVAIPVLTRFTAGYVQDSLTLVLPDALAAVWHGCGGSSAVHMQATLKVQVRLDLRTGQVHGPYLQHGRASDHAAALPFVLPAGALRLANLGYWHLNHLQALAMQQVFWLSRLQTGTAIYGPDGQRREVLALLEAQYSPSVDLPIRLGTTHQLPARLRCAFPERSLTSDGGNYVLRRKGRAANRVCLALANWTILVTNVLADMLSLQEALVLARTRWQIELLFKLWQIELLFKLWKTHGQIDTSRSGKPWRVLCEVYASWRWWCSIGWCWWAVGGIPIGVC